MSYAIRHLTTPLIFRLYESGMRRLLSQFDAILLDDATLRNAELERPEDEASATENNWQTARRLQLLLDNLRTAVPLIWLIVDERADAPSGVFGLCSFTDVIPGRHAYLHGITDPALRHADVVTGLAVSALQTAFEELNVLKVKAEFEADNAGAKGFCWRLGFRREGLLKSDILVNGVMRDVALYTLTRDDYLRFRHRWQRRPFSITPPHE
ncbi:MAG: GNAT family N-acetyltransferase [Candidatus Melainabacteria bacterium]